MNSGLCVFCWGAQYAAFRFALSDESVYARVNFNLFHYDSYDSYDSFV